MGHHFSRFSSLEDGKVPRLSLPLYIHIALVERPSLLPVVSLNDWSEVHCQLSRQKAIS
ncbi:MAG: hypothetical protein ACJA00_003658 [Myxococcota bacterium]|jgi:hypothetical protein